MYFLRVAAALPIAGVQDLELFHKLLVQKVSCIYRFLLFAAAFAVAGVRDLEVLHVARCLACAQAVTGRSVELHAKRLD